MFFKIYTKIALNLFKTSSNGLDGLQIWILTYWNAYFVKMMTLNWNSVGFLLGFKPGFLAIFVIFQHSSTYQELVGFDQFFFYLKDRTINELIGQKIKKIQLFFDLLNMGEKSEFLVPKGVPFGFFSIFSDFHQLLRFQKKLYSRNLWRKSVC